MMKHGIALAAIVVATLTAGSALADPAFTSGTPQVGGGLQYGIFMGDDQGDPPNPYNLGLNVRGGYTLDMGLYVGAGIDYFFGQEKDQDLPFVGTVTASINIWQLGAEVGYDLGLSPSMVLRPKLGLGYATATGKVSGGGASSSSDETGLAITPGVQALFDMGGWFLDAEGRYNILSISTDNGTGGTTDTDLAGLLLGVGAGATF
jgi:hypothetical protein